MFPVPSSDPTTDQLRSTYDAVAYESRAHRSTHPNCLAAEAALAGIAAPPVQSARVLEIGCASGGNIIPMAEQLPAATFVGIDLSEKQIEAGLEVVNALGLANLKLICRDIMDPVSDLGKFDFIIAHGVFGWVPAPVQNRLLEICRALLSPTGMAFISFTVLPGGYPFLMARDMMKFHARNAPDAPQRSFRGREIIRFMAENTPDTRIYRDELRTLLKVIDDESDRQLSHDQMEAAYHATLFSDFMARAREHALAYVGDVGSQQNPWYQLSPSVRDAVSSFSPDPVDREQYLDFLTNRGFRCSVLCHAAASASANPSSERVRALWFAGRPSERAAGLNPQKQPVFEFASEKCKVHVSNPRAIERLRQIRDAWPRALSFADLQKPPAKSGDQSPGDIAPDELSRLLELYAKMGLIEPWTYPPTHIAAAPPARPRVSPYARWQAERDNVVTSLRHEPSSLDPAFRQLLPLLDGSRDRAALAQELIRLKQDQPGGNWPAKNPQHLEQMIDATLNLMTASSLILAE